MFKLTRLLFVPALLITSALRGESPLDSALRAQALLGAETWSQVITIDNDTRNGVYPRKVDALIFELAGLLWFYTANDGTQSFSLRYGELDQDKRNFGPLLRDIEPGFVRWKMVQDHPGFGTPNRTPLRNGCFIESVLALRERIVRGGRVEEPRLLSYYLKTGAGQRGHTVLAYKVGDTIEVLDPDRPRQQFVFSSSLGGDALALARALDGREIFKARYFSLAAIEVASQLIASTSDIRSAVDSQ